MAEPGVNVPEEPLSPSQTPAVADFVLAPTRLTDLIILVCIGLRFTFEIALGAPQ